MTGERPPPEVEPNGDSPAPLPPSPLEHWTEQALQALRDGLSPMASAAPPTGALARFCRDYGLDPECRLDGVEHRVGCLASGEFVLAVHRWTLAGATANLLLVHGYLDHAGLYGKLVEFGLRSGYNVLLYDQPGHGLSSGEPASIADFGHYGRAMDDVMAGGAMPQLPWFAIAQSMGGAAMVEFARQHRWPFQRVVLLAPLVRPAGWQRVRLSHLLIHRLTDSVARNFNDNSADASFLAFVRSDPLQSRRIPVRWVGALRRWLASLPDSDLGVGPVMVVQGEADGTVAWRYNLAAIERLFPGSVYELLPGAGHQLANESADYRARYLPVVRNYLAADPAPALPEANTGGREPPDPPILRT